MELAAVKTSSLTESPSSASTHTITEFEETFLESNLPTYAAVLTIVLILIELTLCFVLTYLIVEVNLFSENLIAVYHHILGLKNGN